MVAEKQYRGVIRVGPMTAIIMMLLLVRFYIHDNLTLKSYREKHQR